MIGNIVVLPSKGILYEGLVGGEVEVLPMKTKQEELLAGRLEMIPILNSLISACVPAVEKSGLHPTQLLSGDRLFLLFMIRKYTYGSSYGFKIKCPSCDLAFRKEINIPDDLEVNELNESDSPPFYTKLSDEKTEIGFRLLTGEDEVEIDRFRTKQFKKGMIKGDPSYTYTIARHIVSIDRKEISLLDAKAFVEEMNGMDSTLLRNAIRDKEPGVSREVEFECPQCGYDIETMMPYSAEFFRPRLGGGK